MKKVISTVSVALILIIITVVSPTLIAKTADSEENNLGAIVGIVLDAKTRLPVTDAEIKISPFISPDVSYGDRFIGSVITDSRGMDGQISVVHTDEKGFFRIEKLEPGKYILSAYALPNYQPQRKINIEVTAKAETYVEFLLRPIHTDSALTSDSSNTNDNDDSLTNDDNLDDKGNSKDGTDKPSEESPQSGIIVIAGRVVEIESKKPIEGAKIRLVKSENPDEKSTVFNQFLAFLIGANGLSKNSGGSSGQDNSEITVTTNSEGFYFVRDLEPGSYLVYASASGYRSSSSKQVTVEPNVSKEVNFELEKLTMPALFSSIFR